MCKLSPLIYNLSFLMTFLLFGLTGCATTPETRTVTEYKIKPIAVSEALLLPCSTTPPPSVDDYLYLDVTDREDLLTNYTISLIKDVELCNNRLRLIKSIQDKQLQLYQSQ